MPEIGSMARIYNGNFDGQLAVANFKARFTMAHCGRARRTSPHFRLFAADGTELGVAWKKYDRMQREYFSLKLDHPAIGTLSGTIRTQPDQKDPTALKIIWTPSTK